MKISIIGSGDVGSHAAHEIAGRQIVDEVVILDIKDGLPQGRALDIRQYCPTIESETRIIGTNSYVDTKNSDIVIIVAGVARHAGSGSRDELLETNKKIIKSVTESVVNYSPNSILLVVTNPVDVMTYLVYKTSGFEKNRVFGMAGVLDTARLKCFIGEKTECLLSDIETMVIGSHGDNMVPLFSKTKIKRRSISEFLTGGDIEEITKKTQQAGKEIVTLTGKSSYFAPGGAIAKMIEIIINDSREIIPCSAYLEGEYELKDIYMGVPVVLGRNGIENVIEFDLDEKEKLLFDKCAENIKENIRKLIIDIEKDTVEMDLDKKQEIVETIATERDEKPKTTMSEDEAISRIKEDIAKIEQDLITSSSQEKKDEKDTEEIKTDEILEKGEDSQPPIEAGSNSPKNPKKLDN